MFVGSIFGHLGNASIGSKRGDMFIYMAQEGYASESSGFIRTRTSDVSSTNTDGSPSLFRSGRHVHVSILLLKCHFTTDTITTHLHSPPR
jgi:hypothetical protein